MPKELAGIGERGGRSSSKNAKDKCNSAALLASRGRAGMELGAGGRAWRGSSEKDSGYSDTGSDSLDDQRSSLSEHQRGGGAGAGSGELTPVYIIKNLVLKQPLAVQSSSEQLLPGQLTWGGGAGHSSQGPAQLLFIPQPGVAGPAPMHILKPPTRKGGERGSKKNHRNGKGTYLPILNSYPRIAPHPSKKTPEQGKAGGKVGMSEGQSSSKRVCMEARGEAVSTTSQMHKKHHHHTPQQEGRPHSHPRGSASHFPHRHPSPSLPRPHHSTRPFDSCSLGSPSISSSQATAPSSPSAPPAVASFSPAPAAPGSTVRQQRFLNTVEILSQSGLLDITLRTQELLRQSAATERDIAQLRHHAQLLCQAARAGPHAPDACDALVQAMAESGHYPNLACPALEPEAGPRSEGQEADATAGGTSTANGKSSPVVAATLINHDNEATPPSPLLATTPGRALEYLGEVLLVPPSHALTPTLAKDHTAKSPPNIAMPPDSSTNGCVL